MKKIILLVCVLASTFAKADLSPSPQDDVSVLVGSSIVIKKPIFIPATTETEIEIIFQEKQRVVKTDSYKSSCRLLLQPSGVNRELQPRTLKLVNAHRFQLTNGLNIVTGFNVKDEGPQDIVKFFQCSYPLAQDPIFSYEKILPKTVNDFESLLKEATDFQIQPEKIIKVEGIHRDFEA